MNYFLSSQCNYVLSCVSVSIRLVVLSSAALTSSDSLGFQPISKKNTLFQRISGSCVSVQIAKNRSEPCIPFRVVSTQILSASVVLTAEYSSRFNPEMLKTEDKANVTT